MSVGLHPLAGSFEALLPFKQQWIHPDALIMRFFASRGFRCPPRPFRQTTLPDDFAFPGCSTTETQHFFWDIACQNLMDRLECVPLEQRNIIAYSHAAQPIGKACLQGLRVNRLVTLCAPNRPDMQETWRLARPHIGQWWQVYNDEDVVQLLGSGGGTARTFPLADRNLRFGERDHAYRMLHDPVYFSLWMELGLLDFLHGA